MALASVSVRGGSDTDGIGVQLQTMTLSVHTDQDVVTLRKLVRERAVAIRLSLIDQTKLVTAASELGRNAVRYGGGGEATLTILDAERGQGIRLTLTDHGPGIADLEQALTDGYTSGGGLGLGLGGARRLVDEFDIQTALGEGTVVSVVKWGR